MIFCEKEPDAKGCRPPGGCMDTKCKRADLMDLSTCPFVQVVLYLFIAGLIMKDGTPCPPKTCPRICGKDEMKCIYPDVWNGCEPIEECLTKRKCVQSCPLVQSMCSRAFVIQKSIMT